ncbi:MAG: 2Fe-2S iron-sulfur cluster-binding protein [Bdellovibrionales bacterium]
MPKCKINGKEIEVPAGTSIIQAIKMLNQDIAHYCWHPGLSVAGVCRLCMVQIEGMPKLQIACNTEVKEGMVINNTSDVVKETVRWGMDFHLINHPLDCPICDQAGECGLQEQYMRFGQYDPEMAEPKVKKKKVVDLGPTVVLDSERCILCSRCVRFTDEVSKTNELGIFNRGDHSEIGTFEGKPLDNKYSLNTVDICPVGALTSKDFRFRQRVWYLKEVDTICPGCSTGCSIKVHFNEEGLWRVKPRYNPEVNGHWMCDDGRGAYKYVNKKFRLLSAMVTDKGTTSTMDPLAAAKQVGEQLKGWAKSNPESVAVVLTGQYTNEEYDAFLQVLSQNWGVKNVYHWLNNPETVESFDGLLIRGDKNPNTKGLLAAFQKHNLMKTWADLTSRLDSGKVTALIVAGPENQAVFPDLSEKIKQFTKAANLVWLAAGSHPELDKFPGPLWQIPLKTYFEKDGTFMNFQGKAQKIKRGAAIVDSSLSLLEVAEAFAGEPFQIDAGESITHELKQNHFTALRGQI